MVFPQVDSMEFLKPKFPLGAVWKLGGKYKAKWWNWMVMDGCVNIATGM